MTSKLDKLEALQNQTLLENKLNLIPTTLRNIYSGIDGTNKLVARELVVDGRVMIGIEYADDGSVASAYTTNSKGKRINLNKKEAKEAPKDLISERLAELSKSITKQQEKKVAKTEQTAVKDKVQKTQVSKEAAAYIKNRGRNVPSA